MRRSMGAGGFMILSNYWWRAPRASAFTQWQQPTYPSLTEWIRSAGQARPPATFLYHLLCHRRLYSTGFPSFLCLFCLCVFSMLLSFAALIVFNSKPTWWDIGFVVLLLLWFAAFISFRYNYLLLCFFWLENMARLVIDKV